MNISEASLINGVEVDMPMGDDDRFTSKAIRYCEDDSGPWFELYDFNTNESIYCSPLLNDIVEHCNEKFGTNDVAVD